MTGPIKLSRPQTPRALAALLVVTLLTGCAAMGSSETERTICRELRRDLPSYSSQDTPETLEIGARFLDVFEAVCE